MEEDKVSPIGIIVTFLLHCSFLYLATANFAHHQPHHTPYDVVRVSIPVDERFHPHEENIPSVNDLITPAEKLVSNTETEQPIDKDRYYLQEELSTPTRVLFDDTGRLIIPIRKIVTMTLYVNEAGEVDDVTIDDKGALTDEEQEHLIDSFKKVVFLPGMRGTKVVKSIFRIQLEINRKVTIHRP